MWCDVIWCNVIQDIPLRGAVLVIFVGEYDVVSLSVYFPIFSAVIIDSIGVAKSRLGKPYFEQIALSWSDFLNLGWTGVVSDIIGLVPRDLICAIGVDGAVCDVSGIALMFGRIGVVGAGVVAYDANEGIECTAVLYGTGGATDDAALRVECNFAGSSTFINDWCDEIGCDEDGCVDNTCCMFWSKSCFDWCALTCASTIYIWQVCM